MTKIFISHSTEDRALIEDRLVRFLHARGFEPWFAQDSIMGAARWEREILQGLKECDWFLVAMSPHAAKSQWVKDEVDWAFARRRGKIIPVLIADCDADDFHIGMAGIQHIDFRGEFAEAQRRLLVVLGGDPTAAPTQPAPAPSAQAPSPSAPVQPAPASPPPQSVEPRPAAPAQPSQDTWRNSLWTFMTRVPAETCKPEQAGQRLFVAATCVTNRDYKEWVDAGGQPPRDNPKDRKKRTWRDREFPAPMAAHPVVLVSQADAKAFCAWLTQREQKEFRIGPKDYYTLPTEQQWKAVAANLPYPDDAVVDRQWVPTLWQPTESVVWGKPDSLGLHGLFGNVFEWCHDTAKKKVRAPTKDDPNATKVVDCGLTMGGGWNSTATWLRQQITQGTLGAVWCPHGGPLQDGGFRLWLVKQ